MQDAFSPASRQSAQRQPAKTTAMPPVTNRAPIARAAACAAALLLANMVLAIAAPGQMGDHSTGAGRLSEGLVGLSFIAGSAVLVALMPKGAWSRITWILAIAGLFSSGLSMLAVLVAATEPPVELFLVEVALAVPALIAVGAVGIRRRTWPWWVGVGMALLLPVMFALPFNSPIMAAVWIAVAWCAVPPAASKAATEAGGEADPDAAGGAASGARHLHGL